MGDDPAPGATKRPIHDGGASTDDIGASDLVDATAAMTTDGASDATRLPDVRGTTRYESMLPLTTFALATGAREGPLGLTMGTDGALWFTELRQARIGRITMSGEITQFQLPPGEGPSGIAVLNDGTVGYTRFFENAIGFLPPHGPIVQIGLPREPGPNASTCGPDGYIWFTETTANKIGRYIGSSHTFDEFAVPTPDVRPLAIVSGPDEALWFTEGSGGIGRVGVEGGVTEFVVPSSGGTGDITLGPDGAFWFTEPAAERIGRITLAGAVAEWTLPPLSITANALGSIATGPDGNVWFTELAAPRIGRITPEGKLTMFGIPKNESEPRAIIAGPDGHLWFTDSHDDSLNRIDF